MLNPYKPMVQVWVLHRCPILYLCPYPAVPYPCTYTGLQTCDVHYSDAEGHHIQQVKSGGTEDNKFEQPKPLCCVQHMILSNIQWLVWSMDMIASLQQPPGSQCYACAHICTWHW